MRAVASDYLTPNSPSVTTPEATVAFAPLKIDRSPRSTLQRSLANASQPVAHCYSGSAGVIPDSQIVARRYNQSYTKNNENSDLDPR